MCSKCRATDGSPTFAQKFARELYMELFIEELQRHEGGAIVALLVVLTVLVVVLAVAALVVVTATASSLLTSCQILALNSTRMSAGWRTNLSEVCSVVIFKVPLHHHC